MIVILAGFVVLKFLSTFAVGKLCGDFSMYIYFVCVQYHMLILPLEHGYPSDNQWMCCYSRGASWTRSCSATNKKCHRPGTTNMCKLVHEPFKHKLLWHDLT